MEEQRRTKRRGMDTTPQKTWPLPKKWPTLELLHQSLHQRLFLSRKLFTAVIELLVIGHHCLHCRIQIRQRSLVPVSVFVFLFPRFRQNLPQRLAAINNGCAVASGTAELAHVASGEGGPFYLLHFQVAVRAGCATGHEIILTFARPFTHAAKFGAKLLRR